MARRKYLTEEEKVFLRETIPGRKFDESTKLFNEEAVKRGWQPLTIKQIKSFASYKGIRTGTSKGNIAMPLGTTSISDGYSSVRVDTPRRWKHLHVHLWEQANGTIPPDHIIIFADGDRQNLTLQNLVCISRRQSGIINMLKIPYRCPETLKTAALMADLHSLMHKRKSKGGGVKC